MKKTKKAGIYIILIGLGLTVFTACTFFAKKKVAVQGEGEITNNKLYQLNWLPLLGIAIIGIGGDVLWQSYKKL